MGLQLILLWTENILPGLLTIDASHQISYLSMVEGVMAAGLMFGSVGVPVFVNT